jgi:hypothetical protein
LSNKPCQQVAATTNQLRGRQSKIHKHFQQKVMDEAGIAPATSCNSRHVSFDAKQALCYLSYTPIRRCLFSYYFKREI